MNKEEVFTRLLSMYEQAERQINRLINEYDDELCNYELKKIEIIVKQFIREYQEAKA